VTRVPPLLGEHTSEVLTELGYDAATIQELARRHVVGL
jgi:crotonobetainyl-CoA:carnitine CoA-transferase CaiB-like acyl-CoA transferase